MASKGLTALPRRRGSAPAHGCGRGGRVVLPLARAAVISTGLRVLLGRAARQLEPLRRRGRHVVLHLHIEGNLLGVAGPSAGFRLGDGVRLQAGRCRRGTSSPSSGMPALIACARPSAARLPTQRDVGEM